MEGASRVLHALLGHLREPLTPRRRPEGDSFAGVTVSWATREDPSLFRGELVMVVPNTTNLGPWWA